MVLDRQGSYTRPVIGLVRCVCKDEHGQSGRSSPIKMRICNLHFFAPIWMAQPIVHNFRRMSVAELEPRQPGFFDYKEGWYEWDGKGKHEEETFAGHTMGCVRLMISDNNVEPFHYHDWGPIEHFAAQGVIKDSIWNARIGSLGLKARVDIPVAGTMINVVNDRLRAEQWPAHQCRKWLARVPQQGRTNIWSDCRFNKTIFEGSAASQAFEWDIAMENKWPLQLRTRWNDGASSQGVGRSKSYVHRTEWEALFRALPHSQPMQSAYIASLMRGDDTTLVAHQHRLLEERNTFATEDLDTAINQLVFRSQGHLQQFVDDRDLFIRVVGEIMEEFKLQQPPYAQLPQGSRAERLEENDADTKWIRIFWGQAPIGPPDRDQWRDHDM